MINLVERKFNDVKGSRLGPASPTVTMGLIAGRADLQSCCSLSWRALEPHHSTF